MAIAFLESLALVMCCGGVYSLPKGCTLSYNHKGEVMAVDCSKKNLTSVPADVPSTVLRLNLHHNNIAFIPNNTFLELSVLNDLDLSYNKLSRLEADAFRGMASLNVLNLSGNRIHLHKASYPERVFADLGQLRSLNIQNNTDGSSTPNTTYPDEALSHLVNLKELHMDAINNVPLGKGFEDLVNLEVLDFSGYGGYCYLLNVSEDMFSTIRTQHPLTLNISHCPIRYIHPLTFKALPTLRVLDFHDNGNFRFENFMVASQSFPTSLQVLNITNINLGRLMTLYGDYFRYLRKTSLTDIIVENNKIFCLDPAAINFLPSTVKYLSLRNNKLMDAQFLLRIIFMPSIEILDIGRQIYYTVKNTNFSPWVLSVEKKSKGYCSRSDPLTVEMANDGKQNEFEQSNKYTLYKHRDNSSVPGSIDYLQSYEDSPLIWSRDKSQKSRNIYGNRKVIAHSDKPQSQFVNVVQTVGHDDPDPQGEFTKSPCNPAVSRKKTHIDIIPLPPTLHTLNGDNIKFGYAIPNVTFSGNIVRMMNLSSDLLYCFGGPVYGLHQLEVFDLSSNQCNDVNPIFFTDMPKLTHLYLHDNNLGESLSTDSKGQTFSSQIDLIFLGLNKNRIHSLPDKMFWNLVNLETLILSDNALSDLGARIGHMNKLNFLDLSRNQFVYLDGHLRKDLDQIALSMNITVDISNNRPMKCTCDTFEFVQWVTETKVIFKNLNGTSCFLKNGSVVQLNRLVDMLDSLWLECNKETIFTIVLIMFVCVVLIVAVLATLYYKRWRLKYLYYIGRRRVNPYNSLGQPTPLGTIMDVFISYDEDDRGQRRIVQEELHPKLQAKHISCLISEVHFLCGRNTREIIEEAVLGTRKTLALLTNDFFKSRDRELEFNMAVLHGMETRQDLVIPVAMETLGPENLPPEVNTYLKAYPSLPYRGDEESFWEELALRLKA